MRAIDRWGRKKCGYATSSSPPIDDHHCLAHVAWTATYAREGKPDVAIDFDVHYFDQELEDGPKVFGWVAGDEQTLLRKDGII